MKKISLTLAGLICAVVVLANISGSESVYAISGCCMERKSSTGQWNDLEKTFEQCEVANTEEDGEEDDIFEASGKVWWDLAC
jgi:hypothetical protein